MKHVLVIDDDPIFAELVEATLMSRETVTVYKAVNGRDAMRMLDVHGSKLDLIVCDVNMPEADGIEVVQELAVRGVRTPILFATGAPPPIVRAISTLARIHNLSVVDTQTKPVNLNHFATLATGAMQAA